MSIPKLFVCLFVVDFVFVFVFVLIHAIISMSEFYNVLYDITITQS